MNKVYGIIIYLKSDTNEQYPFYGLLYDRLYWAEYPLRNLSTYNKYTRQGVDYNIVWREDIIARNGIDAITKSANIDSGGNISNINTFQIRINNTSNIISYLKSLNVSLTGCIVEIIEFSGTDEQSDSQGVNKILTGVIEDGVDGDETTCSLTISASLTRKRKANMAHLIENGGENGSTDIIPITFGESNANEKRLFKAKKIKSVEKKYSIKELFEMTDISPYNTIQPDNLVRLPAFYSSDNKIRLRIGKVADIDVGWGNPVPALKNIIIGKYLVCKEGNPENIGKYRKIIDITNYQLDILNELHPEQSTYNTAWLEFEAEYFSVPPSGNWNANAENQSWFEIVDVIEEYQIETNESDGFYDTNNRKLTNEIEVYYTDENVSKKAIISDVTITDNNKIQIKLKGYNNSTNKLYSYGIIPVTEIQPSDHTDWAVWNTENMGVFEKAADGVWVTNRDFKTELESSTIAGEGCHCDRNIDSSWNFENIFNNYPSYIICITFKFPPIDKNYKFSKAYLLLRLTSTITNLQLPHANDQINTWFSIKTRRWIGGVNSIENTTYNVNNIFSIWNFPDSYTGKNRKNRCFDQTIKGNELGEWTGYNLFDLGVTNKEEYDNIYEGIIHFERDQMTPVSIWKEDFRIYEIAILFETEIDISNDIHTNYKGRKFGDTLIDNPISIIEHCLRYQNWSEKGIEQNWGHYYNNDSEIIKTNGEGSFNASYLDEIKNKKCAFQILDYSKAWTDSIIKLICNEFYLIHYQDGNGKECLDYMFRSEPECQLVTYGDTKGQIGALERPKARDVNCKPVIKYAFDQYSGEYRKELRIKNISESTYNETFVSGFNGSDGQTVWNQCRELYNIVGSVDDNNEGDIELNAIYRYEDALWYLQKRIELMKKCKLSLSVYYEIGKNWRQGTHIKLQLPHETNNEIRECIIEKVTISKSNDTVNVTVLIDDVSVAQPEIAMIQEVIGQNVEQWQESIGSGEDIQEVITNG